MLARKAIYARLTTFFSPMFWVQQIPIQYYFLITWTLVSSFALSYALVYRHTCISSLHILLNTIVSCFLFFKIHCALASFNWNATCCCFFLACKKWYVNLTLHRRGLRVNIRNEHKYDTGTKSNVSEHPYTFSYVRDIFCVLKLNTTICIQFVCGN